MLYYTLRRVMSVITWLLVAYVSYVFLRNVGISPYDLIDQVHSMTTTLFVSVGF
jgi:hypothetical protein